VRRSRPFTIHPRVYSLVPSKLAASAHPVACPIVAYLVPPSTSSLNEWPVVPLAWRQPATTWKHRCVSWT
jgi:hypothetical protein